MEKKKRKRNISRLTLGFFICKDVAISWLTLHDVFWEISAPLSKGECLDILLH